MICINGTSILLKVAVDNDISILQFDITTAFLNRYLDEEIYSGIPECVSGKNFECLKLNKAIYEPKQAPKRRHRRAALLTSKLERFSSEKQTLLQSTFDSIHWVAFCNRCCLCSLVCTIICFEKVKSNDLIRRCKVRKLESNLQFVLTFLAEARSPCPIIFIKDRLISRSWRSFVFLFGPLGSFTCLYKIQNNVSDSSMIDIVLFSNFTVTL